MDACPELAAALPPALAGLAASLAGLAKSPPLAAVKPALVGEVAGEEPVLSFFSLAGFSGVPPSSLARFCGAMKRQAGE